MKRTIEIGIGDFMDRDSILTKKDSEGLDVKRELQQYQDDKPNDVYYEMFFNILYSINSQLWILEDMKRKGVERYSKDESDVAFMITSLNDLRHEVKKRTDQFYESEIQEKKSH